MLSVGFVSCVDPEDEEDDEEEEEDEDVPLFEPPLLLLLPPPLLLDVDPCPSDPPEHATRPATTHPTKTFFQAFMAARFCNGEATQIRPIFRVEAQARAPTWRFERLRRVSHHMLKGSGMNRSTNMTSVRIATPARFLSSGWLPVGG